MANAQVFTSVMGVAKIPCQLISNPRLSYPHFVYAGFKEIVKIIKQCIQKEKTNFVVLNFVVFQQFGWFVCFEQSSIKNIQ